VGGSASGIVRTQIDAAQRAMTKIADVMKNDAYATVLCPQFADTKVCVSE
jgi:hypothetical protein